MDQLVGYGLGETVQDSIEGIDNFDDLIANGAFHVTFDDRGDDWIKDAVHGIVKGIMQGEIQTIDTNTHVVSNQSCRQDRASEI